MKCLARTVRARENEIPSPTNQRKPQGVVDDRLRFSVSQVPRRRPGGRPSALKTGTVPPPNVGAKVVDVLRSHPQLEVSEEAIVAIGCVRTLRGHNTYELSVREGLQDAPVIEVIPGETIHLPAEDRSNTTALDPSHEPLELRPSGSFGRTGLRNQLDWCQTSTCRKEPEFLDLRVN